MSHNIITNYNIKGGVGKTNITIHLAHHLAQNDKRILLIDMDMQCNLTTAAHLPDTPELDASNIFYNVAALQDIAVPVADNIDIVAGSKVLEEVQTLVISKQQGIDKITMLANYLDNNADVIDIYDYIFIDLAPTYNLIAQNVIYATSRLISIVDADINAIDGLQTLHNRLQDLSILLQKNDIKKALSIDTIIINKVDNTKASRDIVDYMINYHPMRDIVASTTIPYSTEYKKLINTGKITTSKRHKQVYADLAQELFKD